MSEDYIAGKHPVVEALRAGRELNKVWIADSSARGLEKVLAEIRVAGVVVQVVERRKLDQLVPGIQHQGIVASVAAYAYTDIEEIIERALADTERVPFVLILDEIEDPHNLGSILRTAECTGVHGVIIPKRRSASLSATVAKTSAGAIEHVPVARVTNIAQTLEKLKEAGFWIAGADVAAPVDVYKQKLDMPLALVIGNEAEGIGRLIRERCDFLLKLPMEGRLNSLNASVAAGVLMYEVLRQRHTTRS